MASNITHQISEAELAELKVQIRHLETLYAAASERKAPPTPIGWLLGTLQALSLATIAAGAFWLGGIERTVTLSSDSLRQLNQAVTGAPDSLNSRMSAVETKLDGMERTLDRVEEKVSKP